MVSASEEELNGGGIKCIDHKCPPYPNLVVEVADKYESLKLLKEELRKWISRETSVMIAVGIKIFTRSVTMKPRMLISVYTGNTGLEPQQTVEFGSNIEDEACFKCVFKDERFVLRGSVANSNRS